MRTEIGELAHTMWAARRSDELMDTVSEIESLKSTLEALQRAVVNEVEATHAVKPMLIGSARVPPISRSQSVRCRHLCRCGGSLDQTSWQQSTRRVGNTVAVVEGRDVDLSPWDNASTGVGIGGRLELVGGRCVGFLRGSDVDQVIVWPPGTEIRGPADDLRISSEGKTVRLGQEIDAGKEFGHDFTGTRQMLPRACRQAKLVHVGLSS